MAIQLNQLHTYLAKHVKWPQPLLLTVHGRTRFQVKAADSTNARQLIQSGMVRPIMPKDAANAMSSHGYVLLDVRPKWEREKARVAGSLHVPLFIQDLDNSPLTLLKKWVHFGYIGLWTGQKFTTLNPDFLQNTEAVVPGQ
uniref:Rhodanese domain-containing protein n=1 Tax=Rhizophora mucronata TaxID=61149 RepID=A0A2P2JDM7_RHIMU